MSLRWAYTIHPNLGWFQDFADDLSTGDIVILQDLEDDRPTAFAWSSPHLNELDKPADVADRAAALKALFDGSLFLSRKDYIPIEFDSLVSLNDDASVRVGTGSPLVAPFSANLPAAQGAKNFVSTSIALARRDSTVANILGFLGVNGPTWITLYGLGDFLKHARADVAELAGVSASKIALFERTANNFAAIGPFARHGDLGWQPPRNPMSLEQARTIILLAVRNFVDKRAAGRP